MLAELRMNLETEAADIGYFKSSNLQGVLMERISTEYAQKMHEMMLHPYSQHIEKDGDRTAWVVCTVDEEAYNEIIVPLMDAGFCEFEFNNGTKVIIKEKKLSTEKKELLIKDFYNGTAEKYMNIEFITPTSFKRDGKYVIMPEIRLILQSLMNKYSSSTEDMELYDEDMLEQICDSTYITQYKLQSTVFPMEGIKIPSFKGRITIRVNGPDSMARYIRLLLSFGQYSGVGIKTAVGMGAIRLIEGRK